MCTLFQEYNKSLLKYILFKDKNLFSKIYMIMFYLLEIMLVLLLATKSIIIALKGFFIFNAFMYLILMITFFLIEAPGRYIFKDTLKICERVEKIFKKDFYIYNKFLIDKKMPNINKMIYKKKLPDKKMLSLWKYKLSSRKETFQITLPIVALMLLGAFNIPIKSEIYKAFQNYVDITLIEPIDKQYLKWIIQVFSYPYVFIIYHSNIDRINNAITKIDFLRDVT